MTAAHELAQYPLRQTLRASRGKLASLRHSGIADWLSKPERCLLVNDEDRITIHAANESTLEEVGTVIAEALGGSVEFGAPQVVGVVQPDQGGCLQPVMFVRVQTPRACAARVREELVRRRARILEEDLQHDAVVLRAEARLADLLGFSKFLRELAGHAAVLWSWLLRYEAIESAGARSGANADPAGPP